MPPPWFAPANIKKKNGSVTCSVQCTKRKKTRETSQMIGRIQLDARPGWACMRRSSEGSNTCCGLFGPHCNTGLFVQLKPSHEEGSGWASLAPLPIFFQLPLRLGISLVYLLDYPKRQFFFVSSKTRNNFSSLSHNRTLTHGSFTLWFFFFLYLF